MSQSALLKSRRFSPFFFTQFLGAFNDNIFKNTLMLILAFNASEALGMSTNIVMNLAAFLFILPFFLFSAIAGQVTEKYEKSALMRRIKLAEIALMSLAAVFFMTENYPALLLLLFAMGVQSAFFGPAKYSILPQHLEPNELVGGNALVQMGTFVAILLGTIGAGLIMELSAFLTCVSALVITLSVLGYLSARKIPSAPSYNESLTISFNPLKSTFELIRIARSDRSIFLAIVAISWFWFLGASYLTQFNNFAKETLSGDPSLVTLLLATFVFGIGFGSLICEKLSNARVELGIVPIGAFGLSFFGIDLYFAIPSIPFEAVSWSQFVFDVSSSRLLIDLCLIGFFGGVFIVPLNAFVQKRSPDEQRGRMIAVINIMNALFMVVSAIAGVVFLEVLGLSIVEFFLVVAIMNIVVCCYVFKQVDEFAIRFIVWMLSHTMYRVKHKNTQLIPQEGACVLVCNHVSYVDALILAGASPRPVRFVMDHGIFKSAFLGWFFRAVKAIPIAPEHKNKQVYDAAFDSVSEALRNNELVCIFPEGKLTRSGDINPFKKGIELIINRDPVPVIPMALKGLWGSFFSHKTSPAFTKLPKRFWSRVELEVGDVVAPENATAAHLQQTVETLRADQR